MPTTIDVAPSFAGSSDGFESSPGFAGELVSGRPSFTGPVFSAVEDEHAARIRMGRTKKTRRIARGAKHDAGQARRPMISGESRSGPCAISRQGVKRLSSSPNTTTM